MHVLIYFYRYPKFALFSFVLKTNAKANKESKFACTAYINQYTLASDRVTVSDTV